MPKSVHGTSLQGWTRIARRGSDGLPTECVLVTVQRCVTGGDSVLTVVMRVSAVSGAFCGVSFHCGQSTQVTLVPRAGIHLLALLATEMAWPSRFFLSFQG